MTIDWQSPLWGQINIRVEVEGDCIAVKGNTYGIKEDLKPLGARFRGSDKAWVLANTPTVFEGLKQVVAKHGPGSISPAGRGAPAARLDQGEALPPMDLRAPQPAPPAPRQPSQPPSAEPKDLTIAAFVAQVEQVLRQQFPQSVWLVGEIQNLSVRPSATYLQLAEPKNASMTSTTSVGALIWGNKAQLIRRQLTPPLYDKIVAEGMMVRVLCQVRLYKDRGSLSLTILEIDPAYSEGVLALQRQKVLKALRAKGLAELNKRLRPSPVPLRIGLISAADSRAINDFLHQLFQYGFPGNVIVHHASMQGEKTSPEVRKALAALGTQQLDYIVITRGGGSAADLRFFDDEALGEAICRCPVPVVAAIGHHDDRSVAEEVAFRREKTPTSAAVFLLQSVAEVREFLGDSAQKIARELRRHLLSHDDQLQLLAGRIKQHSSGRLAAEQLALSQAHGGLRVASQNLLHAHQQRLSTITRQFGQQLTKFHYSEANRLAGLADSLQQAALGSLARRQTALTRGGHKLKSLADASFFRSSQQLSALENQLEQNDPKEWQRRGLIRLSTKEGKVVRSVADVAVAEALSARLSDGYLDVAVTAKRPAKD